LHEEEEIVEEEFSLGIVVDLVKLQRERRKKTLKA
jgi:hypothetical protein